MILHIAMTVLFGVPALLIVWAGIAHAMKTRRFLAAARRIPATLIGYRQEVVTSSTSYRTSTSYRAIVEFVHAGEKRQLMLDPGSDPRDIKEGSPVALLYTPERTEIDTWTELWAHVAMAIGVGSAMLLILAAYWAFGVR